MIQEYFIKIGRYAIRSENPYADMAPIDNLGKS